MNIESHPFPPFIPENPRMFVMGTFPPQSKRWTFEFYYPNWNNDYWRICGRVFYNDRNRFCDLTNKTFKLDEIKRFLAERHIAMSDTGTEVVRLKDNASDKFLDMRKTIDINAVLDGYPTIDTLVTTGEKAAGVIAGLTHTETPKMGEYAVFEHNEREIYHFRMPSTSRAFPMSLEKKAEMYARVFERLNM